MVPSHQENVVGMLHLQRHQQGNDFNGFVSTVHIVSHKQVGGLGWSPTSFEHPSQIVKLAVDVTTNGDRSFQRKEHGLGSHNAYGFQRELLEEGRGEVWGGVGGAFEEFLGDLGEVGFGHWWKGDRLVRMEFVKYKSVGERG